MTKMELICGPDVKTKETKHTSTLFLRKSSLAGTLGSSTVIPDTTTKLLTLLACPGLCKLPREGFTLLGRLCKLFDLEDGILKFGVFSQTVSFPCQFCQ